MLRRSISKVSSVRRIPRQITTQIPAFLSFRKELSSTSKEKASQGAGPQESPPAPGGKLSKIVVGGGVLGAVVITAYQTGYLDQIFGKQRNSSGSATTEVDSEYGKNLQRLGDHEVLSKIEEINRNQKVDHDEQEVGTHENFPRLEDSNVVRGDSELKVEDNSDLAAEENTVQVHKEDLADHFYTTTASDDQDTNSRISSEGNLDMKKAEAKPRIEVNKEVSVTSVSILPSAIPKENEIKSGSSEHSTIEGIQQEALGKSLEAQYSLPGDYNMRDEADKIFAATSTGKGSYGHKQFLERKEATDGASEVINDPSIAKDGTLVLDFLQAIHAAEKRQSDLDAYEFAKEKRALKEKYEKELKDARVRELMYAEEAAILDEELNKEKMKAAVTIKSLEEIAEEKLKMELEEKEKEAELKLKEVQELAKAEQTAAIALEKASQIEKMAEANLHINALCMAFYAQSQEARQSHSVHKLALGALALEDTLSKGLPIQMEIEALHTSLEGIDRDSLLDLVLSSLPEETRSNGTDTLSQLHQKFDALKGTLRLFSLIPPGGGGLLTYSLAHVASWLKVKETGKCGDGIESVIHRVESYLVEGRIAEAADALEEGVRGSRASEIIGDWTKRARSRAVTEQALTVLQSYATSISLA